jgi:RNA polymerase sigma factor (sigma-70 family)
LQHLTDNELLLLYKQSNNNKYIAELLQRYTNLLLGTCLKYLKNMDDAKDAVQHIQLKCITDINKYEINVFNSWLYILTKNHCLYLLKTKKNIFSTDDKDYNISAEESNEEEFLAKELIFEKLDESLLQLNEDQRICVTLFYLEKQSYTEISVKTGFTMLQVKSYIQNGKRNLKMMIQNKIKS